MTTSDTRVSRTDHIILAAIFGASPHDKRAFGGRINELGGFQSMSRDAKQLPLRGLSKYYEYDLEASQPNALRLWFDKAEIDTKG